MMARSNLKMLGTAALSMWPAMNDDSIPTIGEHRGVGLHDHQSPKRLARVTREIDTVLGVNDITLLLEIAADVTWSPEARLTAAAKLRAMHELADDQTQHRPSLSRRLHGQSEQPKVAQPDAFRLAARSATRAGYGRSSTPRVAAGARRMMPCCPASSAGNRLLPICRDRPCGCGGLGRGAGARGTERFASPPRFDA